MLDILIMERDKVGMQVDVKNNHLIPARLKLLGIRLGLFFLATADDIYKTNLDTGLVFTLVSSVRHLLHLKDLIRF